MTVSRTTCRDDEVGSRNSLTTRRACCVGGDNSISTPTKMRLFMVVPGVPLVQLGLLRHRCVMQRTHHHLRQTEYNRFSCERQEALHASHAKYMFTSNICNIHKS